MPATLRRRWAELAAGRPGAPAAFDPSAVADLPEAASRWLRRAIAPGAPMARAVELQMHGEIRIGGWRPFRAEQVINPALGYIWAATSGQGAARVRGFDSYLNGAGQMRWRLLGLLPVMRADGPDVSRSAAGRLAGELILCPPALIAPEVAWEGEDDRTATARVSVGGWPHALTLEIDGEGRLVHEWYSRWGNPDGGVHRQHRFGAEIEDETRFGDYTIPSALRAGWWYGSERWPEGEVLPRRHRRRALSLTGLPVTLGGQSRQPAALASHAGGHWFEPILPTSEKPIIKPFSAALFPSWRGGRTASKAP